MRHIAEFVPGAPDRRSEPREGSQFGTLCNSDPFKVGAAYAMRAARLPESIINRHTGS